MRFWFFAVLAAGLAACGSQAVFTPTARTEAPGANLHRALASPGNVIQNPGFEDGLAHWKQCGNHAATISRTTAHGGKKSALVGTTATPELKGYAAICQSVTVPAAGRLTFWVNRAADVSNSEEWQRALIADPDGRVLETLYKTAANSHAWQRFGADLSGYAGRTVTIRFDVHGTGRAGDYVGQYVDDVSLTGSVSTPSPSPSPSPSSSPSPSPTSSATPTTAPTGSPCLQSQAAGQADTASVVAYTSVTGAITSARQVCLSAYVFTDAMFSALDSAARNGAKVTVVLPNEERSDDTSDANALAKDGATIVWDPGAPNDYPLHAKMAIVDGVAYLDGSNWDTTDVTITDGDPGDFAAIENALNLNPTSSANIDTLKSLAIAREDAFINGASPAAGVTVQFISESFGSDANTVTALEHAAMAGATVQVIVLAEDENGNSSEENTLNAMKADGVQIRLSPGSGSEKMTLVSGQSTAWFGSANATSSSSQSYNYIDWGLIVSNSATIASLQSYFTSTWNSSTAF